MALVVADRVKETTTTTGTGAITLAGAATNFVTFSSVLSNGDTTYYAIVDDANTDFEVGLGTYASSGNTLTRTTVLASTNSGSAVNLSAGSKEVFVTYPAGKSVNRDASGNVTVSGGVTVTQVDVTAQGDIRLQDSSGGEYVALQAASTVASSYTLTLPTTDGNANEVLKTDGSGVLSWVAQGGGVTVYSTIDDLPLSGVNEGSMALVDSTDRLYIFSDSGWYNIALVNTTPSISGANPSYNLAVNGSATVVTIVASDPEGIPITYSLVSDTSGSIATVVQGTGANTNVFTITPSTNTAHAGTFSLTFRATDGVNIASAASSFTLQFQVTNSKYTTALVTSVGANNAVNNAFDDSSTNNHTVTASGNVTQNSFSPYGSSGHSVYFDGTGDYLQASDSSLQLGSGDFTVELWIWPDGTSLATNAGIYTNAVESSGTSGSIRILIDGADETTIKVMADTSTLITSASGAITVNKWNHVALVRSGSGSNNMTLYVNGSSSGTATNTTDWNQQYALLGNNIFSSTNYLWKGYIRDARVVPGTAITPPSGGPTAPLTAVTNTSLLACQLPYIADGSTESNAITVNGDPTIEALSPYDYQAYESTRNGGSGSFDGAGDYLKVASSADFNLYNTAFTVEGWFYATAPAGDEHLFSSYIDGSNRENLYFSDATTLKWAVNGTDRITATVVANVWNHVAIVDNSGTTTMYINGVSKGTWSSTYSNGNRLVWIGTYNDGSTASDSFTGFLSDWRVVKGTAVTPSPPTAPLTAITNTSLLLHFDDAGIIDKSQSIKTMDMKGDVKSSTTQTKYLSSSMYFDGTGDYIQANSSDIGNFGTAAFTAEGWFYLTASPADYISVVGTRTAGGSTTGWVMAISASNFYIYSGAFVASKGSAISSNTWYHWAYTRDASGNHRLFLDGTQIGSTSTLTRNYSDDNFTIGAKYDGTELFTGYQSDVRFTKGLARYTSNFTPPSSALDG